MKIVEPCETSALESAGLTPSSPSVLSSSSSSSSKTKLILFFIALHLYYTNQISRVIAKYLPITMTGTSCGGGILFSSSIRALPRKKIKYFNIRDFYNHLVNIYFFKTYQLVLLLLPRRLLKPSRPTDRPLRCGIACPTILLASMK